MLENEFFKMRVLFVILSIVINIMSNDENMFLNVICYVSDCLNFVEGIYGIFKIFLRGGMNLKIIG